jgi:hypothetical protein
MASNGRAQVVMMMMTMMKLNFCELSAAFLRHLLHEADLLKLGVLIDENSQILKIHGAFVRPVDAQHECAIDRTAQFAFHRFKMLSSMGYEP